MSDHHFGKSERRSPSIYAIILSSLLVISIMFSSAAIVQQAHAQSAPPVTVIYVSTAGSDVTGNGSIVAPYSMISYAVSVAPPHSIIMVEPGVYNEMINITKPVSLESMSSDPSNTVINAIGQTYGIYVLGPGASGTIIRGFTVENANNHGIFVQDASDVTVEYNLVINNGLHPNPRIVENKAIELTGTSFSVVLGNTVINNIADGGIGVSDDGPINPGGLSNGTPGPALGNIISGNTIIGNTVGCGIVIAAYNPGEGVINNIVSNNYVANGLPGGIVVAADVPHTSAINNSVIDNTVIDNLIPGIIVHSNTPGDVVSGTRIIGNIVSGNGGFGPMSTGINLIGNINGSTIVRDTIISGNTLSNEYFGILVQNATSTKISPDNYHDASVTVPVQGARVLQSPDEKLKGEVSSLSGELSQLQSTAANQSYVSSLSSSLSSVTSKVNSLTLNVSSLSTAVSAMVSRVSSISGQESTATSLSYVAIVIAIVLGVIAIALSMRKRN